MAGRPASSAYAMPCGTSSVVSTRPATTSFGSHSRRYSRSMRTPAGPVIEFAVFSPAASATATTIGVSHSARFIGGDAQRAKPRISQHPFPGGVPSGLATYTIGRVRTPSHEGSDDRGAAAIAVALSAACWMVFAALAIVVSTSDTPSVDQSVLTWVVEHRSSGVTSAMRIVTWLGSAAVLHPPAPRPAPSPRGGGCALRG